MGILDRMSQVLRANINDMLNRAEDPEKMLNQILRDMEDAIQQGTSQVAEQIAQAKMIQHDLDDAKQQSDDWGKKAELAVTKGRDDLAKEALRRQNDYTHQVDIYQNQLAAQQNAVEKLKADLDALKAKYDDARRNKDMLIARAKRTDAQKQMAQAASKISTTDYSSELSRMQRRIEEGEARVEADKEVAKTSVDDDFAKLGSDDQLDAQLADLKKKMGK
jgi:phage shock protein A